MSSVDSGINSCSAAFMVDFWQRLKYGEICPSESGQGEGPSERERVVLARIFTVILGTVVTILACFVGSWVTSSRSPTRSSTVSLVPCSVSFCWAC